jgi:hypothetical protein
MATVGERGGFGLVASVADREGGEELVAEAGYTPLPDGDGELEITVARPWRGWLGHYLLDALLSAAADRGVPNLQADVLLSNGPMLSLIRSRGYATLDSSEGAVVRVLIGTSGPSPRWSGPHTRPRVLVESPGGRWHATDAARRAGLQVIVCPGPRAVGAPCPALDGKPCPLAAGADAIVVSHPRDDDRWAALPLAHAELHPGIPVCVQLRGTDPPPPGLPNLPAGSDTDVVAFVERLARTAGPVEARPD